jgi:CheY-specific phosphatase CheX
MPAPHSVSDDVRDVMGELANMIAGNLKCTLAPGIRISVPSVTDGAEYSVRVCRAREVIRAGFDTDAGPCWISLVNAGEAD